MNSVTSTVPSARDAADVVAAEVDQHDVLGALLRVGQQLLRQRAVLLRRRAARARAGDRPRHHAPARACAPASRARRRPASPRELEQDHVGARVDQAQRAVERERRRRLGGERKRRASTTWKMSPAAMYSLAVDHGARGTRHRQARPRGARELRRRRRQRIARTPASRASAPSSRSSALRRRPRRPRPRSRWRPAAAADGRGRRPPRCRSGPGSAIGSPQGSGGRDGIRSTRRTRSKPNVPTKPPAKGTGSGGALQPSSAARSASSGGPGKTRRRRRAPLRPVLVEPRRSSVGPAPRKLKRATCSPPVTLSNRKRTGESPASRW